MLEILTKTGECQKMKAAKETKVTVNIPSAEKWELNEDGTYSIKIAFAEDVYNSLRIDLDSIPDYITCIKTGTDGIVLIAHGITDIVGSFLTFITAPTMKKVVRNRT